MGDECILYIFVCLLLAVSCPLPLLPAVQHQGSAGCAGSACTALLAAGVLCVKRVLSLSVSQRALCDPHGGMKVQILEQCCKKQLYLSSGNIYMC